LFVVFKRTSGTSKKKERKTEGKHSTMTGSNIINDNDKDDDKDDVDDNNDGQWQ
jgi:hypothetical protein